MNAACPPDILVVDDAPANLRVLVEALKARGLRVRPVLDGRQALEAARAQPPSLVLLDINMPGLDGFGVCAAFKDDPRLAPIPIIFLSANAATDDKVLALAVGGVDYVTKPFQVEEVYARVGTHLELRRLQDELDRHNHELEARVRAQVEQISSSHVATILALAKLAEFRDEDTGNHILRVQHYCRALATHLARTRAFGGTLYEGFPEDVFHASALHDIGKVGIPDAILLKPGRLNPAEFEAIKAHTTLGADTPAAVLRVYPDNAFVRLGMELARWHHERWCGGGYPDGLIGEAIPVPARIFALADQYDALRSKRPYKPPFDAERTFTALTDGDGRSHPSHFDPRVLAAFVVLAPEFAAIHARLGERPEG